MAATLNRGLPALWPVAADCDITITVTAKKRKPKKKAKKKSKICPYCGIACGDSCGEIGL